MKVLALDLATKSGWATNVGRQSGVQTFDVKRGESPGMRFLRCRAWLQEMLDLLGGIDVIVYEQAHHRGGAATAVCVGVISTVLTFAAENGIETMAVHTGELKRWATGKGTFLGVPFTAYLDEIDKAERPWLVNNEVCAYLDYANPRDAIKDLENWERGVVISDTGGGKRFITLISESGLYTLASKSRKPNARRFRQWVYAEVVPSIRRTGQYSTKPQVEGPDVEVRAMINDNDFLQHKLLELLQFNREHRKQLEVKDHLTDIGLLKAGKETVN